MKRILSLVVIILVVGLSLLNMQKSNSDVIKLKFTTWGSKTEMDILNPLVNEFEKNNPDIKIELIHIPQNYFQKLHLLFASNSAPDVLFINNLNLPFFANADVIMPIEDVSKEFEPKALKSLSYNGKIYAIPRDISVLTVFRNKDLFKKCNVPLSSEKWTIDEFLLISQKFKTCNVYSISFEESPSLFYLPYLMSEGGGILSDDTQKVIYNSKETQKGLELYSDLRKKYKVAPTSSDSANLTMAQMFLNQKIAMHLTGHWLVPKYLEEANFKWDTVTFPKGTKGSIVSLDASGWAISKNTKYPKEARRFVDFLSSKENIELFTKSGLIVPAREDVIKGEFLNSPYNKAFINAVKTAKPTPVSVNYKELNDKLKQENESLFN